MPPLHNRGNNKIREFRHVHDIDETESFLGNLFVNLLIGCCRNDKEYILQVSTLIPSLYVCYFTFHSLFFKNDAQGRTDDFHAGTGTKKGGDFPFSNVTTTNNNTFFPFEIYEGWIVFTTHNYNMPTENIVAFLTESFFCLKSVLARRILLN